MGWLPIVNKGKKGGCHGDWPLFYMNDFSQLGLVVPKMAATLAALRSGGFTIHEREDASLVEITDQGQLRHLMRILTQQRLPFEISDVVSCVYQG